MTVDVLPPIGQLWAALRARRPLVHNITNYVVMNGTANVLLAAGASPAMVHACEEVEDFVAISQALVINIGTLSPPWVEAMERAATTARRLGRPWVLDPVGAGATPYRTAVARRLAGLSPSVIRGNASEIMALAGAAGAQPSGVDSRDDSAAALPAATALSAETGAAVAVTGAIDWVVTPEGDAHGLAVGTPRLTAITGTGCAVTALVGAMLGAGATPAEAALAALAGFGLAGERAAMRAVGPGSLEVALIDALAALDPLSLDEALADRWRSA